jgi:nuclear pore complex protein Nup133
VYLLDNWRLELINSWEEIANTSGRSDEAQRQLLRQTLAYQTLKYMAASTGKRYTPGDCNGADQIVLPADYELSPEQASQEPLMIELSARFNDWQAEDLEGLMSDHQSEIAQLGLWRDSGLDDMIKEVKELMRRDTEVNTVDVVMS